MDADTTIELSLDVQASSSLSASSAVGSLPHKSLSGAPPLAYDLIQGHRSSAPASTAVLLHGILGRRRDWSSFARRLAQEFPSWQFLLVDLRCHGDSAKIAKADVASVASAASDVLRLVAQLGIAPQMLIGHSFGGKVALSMIDQAPKPLGRPVRVWVLDATPGKVRAGLDGEDAPLDIITALRQMPDVVPSGTALINTLIKKGLSMRIAQYMTTNLQPVKIPGGSLSADSAAAAIAEEGGAGLSWVFDLEGITRMYMSYEKANLWPLVEKVPEGVHIDFVKAERSVNRWASEDMERIFAAGSVARGGGAGVSLHVLEKAGHWVHTDNPDGLFRLMAPSFGSEGILHHHLDENKHTHNPLDDYHHQPLHGNPESLLRVHEGSCTD